MNQPARKRRFGGVVVLGVLIALIAGYLGNCFQGLGLTPGDGSGARAVQQGAEMVKKTVGAATTADAKARVTVEGERCRLGDEALRACDEVCKEIHGVAEIEATAGAQHTVDALRTCLQQRDVKIRIVSE